jgi:hypothetical protein
MASVLRSFVERIVAANDDRLFNYGPDEQIARALEELERFARTTPLVPVADTVVDLAGFGEAAVHFDGPDDRYMLLSEVAEQLGMPVWTACEWARLERLHAVDDQRDIDERRGDGRLGWECLRGVVDLRLDFIADDPEAKPDADGKRWSSYGDWLLSTDRLPAFMLVSPWGREFMDNTFDAFAHGMRKTLGAKLDGLTAVDRQGNPMPGVELFASDLTEEEALRKARRGPSGALEP